MSAAWGSVLVAVIATAIMAGGLIWRDGRRDGKIDAVLERLTDLTEDLDDRVRILELRPARRRRHPPR
jgi:hypothetical protein